MCFGRILSLQAKYRQELVPISVFGAEYVPIRGLNGNGRPPPVGRVTPLSEAEGPPTEAAQRCASPPLRDTVVAAQHGKPQVGMSARVELATTTDHAAKNPSPTDRRRRPNTTRRRVKHLSTQSPATEQTRGTGTSVRVQKDRAEKKRNGGLGETVEENAHSEMCFCLRLHANRKALSAGD